MGAFTADSLAQTAAAVLVQAPASGCWLAAPCVLRVTAVAPARLAADPPRVLSRVPALDVLSISADASGSASAPQAWLIKLVAFQPGDLTPPPLSVQVLSESGAVVSVVPDGVVLQVQQRQHPAGTALADIELYPPALPLATIAAGAGAVLIGLLGTMWLWRLARRRALPVRLVAPHGSRRLFSGWRGRRDLRRIRRSRKALPAAETYTQMIAVIRRTLRPRLGALALSATSTELRAAVARQARPAGVPELDLAPLLVSSDLVKFGGYVPTDSEVTADCDRALAVLQALDRARLTTAAARSRS